MSDDGAIHLSKDLSEALTAEAQRDALAEEAITRHLEARKTLERFAALRAEADWDLLDRVLSRKGGEPPADDDRVPEPKRRAAKGA